MSDPMLGLFTHALGLVEPWHVDRKRTPASIFAGGLRGAGRIRK